MTKKTFLHGAVILSAAAIIIKIIGACFRIPLGNLIGDEGMAYYSAPYAAYSLLVTISTAGIPVAVSRLVAERVTEDDPAGATRVLRISLTLMALLGIVFFCVLFFGAEFITADIQKIDGAFIAMRALAPALLFVPVMAALRGYFQGMQNMKPTAASQLIEQLFRVICGLILAVALISMGTEYAAAGGTFGATAGGAAGLVVMLVLYSRFRKQSSFRKRREEARQLRDARRESTLHIIGKILAIAVPIIIGASILPIMYNIDAAVVTRRLISAGYSKVEALSMFGGLVGFAEPIIGLPKVLTQALAISMVPTVVRAFKQKDRDFLHYNVTLGLRFALIIGLPCTVGLMILSEPVMRLLYASKLEGAVAAAPSLFIFAIGIVFLCSIDALTSVLQGVGKQMIPVVNIAIGAAFKLVLTFTLTGTTLFNVKGAAIGTVAAYAVATLLNYRAVVTYTGTRFDPKLTFVRPLISVAAMGVVSAAVYYAAAGAAGNAV
ncbi:MAG: polysaccharide biosynthesis protein, partial [Clostridiales Family XIII bacterium]|nr:polysaccharide biosynthesis protein [Clostridiales Family XIII bacterium]